MVLNFGVLVCMQAAEAASSSTNDSTASEEVVAVAAAKELEARSTDLDDVSRVKQSEDDVAAAEKAVEGDAFGYPATLKFFACA